MSDVLGIVLKRLGLGLITLLVISILIFFAVELLPGDIAEAVLGQGATAENLAAMREQMGLNKPAVVRYFEWLGGAVTGNFGESIVASAVFNGTDMMRGEGVLTNLGEIAYDIVLAGVYVVVDQLYLAIPGLPPIVVLPDRPPVDRPLDWRRPLPPQPGRDLVVPFDPQPEDMQSVASDESAEADAEPAAAVPDEISEETVDTEESTAEEIVGDVETLGEDDALGEDPQDAPTEEMVAEVETVEEAETEAAEPETTEAPADEPETDDDGDETSDAAEE